MKWQSNFNYCGKIFSVTGPLQPLSLVILFVNFESEGSSFSLQSIYFHILENVHMTTAPMSYTEVLTFGKVMLKQIYVCGILFTDHESFVRCTLVCWYYRQSTLAHWCQDKMAAVFQTTLSNAFSWMKMLLFWLKFHWSLLPRSN